MWVPAPFLWWPLLAKIPFAHSYMCWPLLAKILLPYHICVGPCWPRSPPPYLCWPLLAKIPPRHICVSPCWPRSTLPPYMCWPLLAKIPSTHLSVLAPAGQDPTSHQYLSGPLLAPYPWPCCYLWHFNCSNCQFIKRERSGRDLLTIIQEAGPPSLFPHTTTLS